MSIFKRAVNIEPDTVFKPRGEYDATMYISRPDYERPLNAAMNSDLCLMIHGQSGTGKTWLTRRALENARVYYKVVNLAIAANHNSIYTCFRNNMQRENWRIRTKHTETKSANVSVPTVAQGALAHASEYVDEVDYYFEFLKFMQHRADDKHRRRYIIFENFEAIIGNENLIRELSNLITLIDDDEVAKYKTKFIIIGATNVIQKYFTNLPNINTIENRICELPEIGTFRLSQVHSLIERGFQKLQIRFESTDLMEYYKSEITKTTGGLPQRVHEFCLNVALLCKDNNWTAKKELIQEARETWIKTSLSKNYAFINTLLSHDPNVVSRKNQVLYCIAQRENIPFKSTDIDTDIGNEFPSSTKGISISTTKQLNELTQTTPPLLEKNDFTNEYFVNDFKCVLCLRAMLFVEDEKVLKYSIYDI